MVEGIAVQQVVEHVVDEDVRIVQEAAMDAARTSCDVQDDDAQDPTSSHA